MYRRLPPLLSRALSRRQHRLLTTTLYRLESPTTSRFALRLSPLVLERIGEGAGIAGDILEDAVVEEDEDGT